MLQQTTIALLALTGQVACWGGLGHRTVGYIAQKHFTDEAAQLFESLIQPTDSFDISDAAIWADGIRHNRGYTEGWHFIGKDNQTNQCSLRSRYVNLSKTPRTARLNNVALISRETVKWSRVV